MRRITCLMFLLAVCGIASAYVVTFDDLTAGDQYYVGDTFTSGTLGGMDAVGSDFYWLPMGSTDSGVATVEAGGLAGGSGNEIHLNNINLDFSFDINPLYGLSLMFGEHGGNVNLSINGDMKNVEDFSALNMTTIGGTTVLVAGTNTSGAIVVIGDITSFGIGGQELWIDNIVASVPEPATMALLGLGGLLLRKRRS